MQIQTLLRHCTYLKTMLTKLIRISKPDVGKKELTAVSKVLQSGMLAQGKIVEKFEKQFGSFIGISHASATSSGTTALHLALLAAGVGVGDEVITTPFSFIASSNAILYTGAIPIFVDIKSDGFNIDPDQIEARITKKTKTLLIVHLYGQPCDMDKIMPIVNKHHLTLIEDCCQAHGASYKGKKVGSFGIGCFSFYATKNMTTGEGGMITTNDSVIDKNTRLLRSHGSKIQYLSETLGYNFRLTEFQATIGIEQLKKLPKYNLKRKDNARYLSNGLEGIRGLITPCIYDNTDPVFHQYTIKIKDDFKISRDNLQFELGKIGIETKVFYPIPIHQQPIYMRFANNRLPIVERVSKEVLSLPVHPRLTKRDLDLIIKSIKKIAGT